MKQIKGGVTAAKGYEAASTAAGIKYNTEIEIECDGEDEEKALSEIIKGFENNFGEEQK